MNKFEAIEITKYWRLVKLEATGKTKTEEIILAKEFFEQQFNFSNNLQEFSDSQIQKDLFGLVNHKSETRDSDRSINAQICLRCFISHHIEIVCIQLANQFGRENGFECHDLYPFVLDDTLEDWRGKKTQSTYQPLAIKIIASFDAQKANLSTWTVRLVKQNKELNSFLLEHGIYLISNWAILNDTTPKQVHRILEQFHSLTSEEIKQASALLESYHAVYRQDRLKQRLQSRGKCPTPSGEQLTRIAQLLQLKTQQEFSAKNILAQLEKLAQLLREYRIHVRSGKLRAEKSLDNPDINSERLQPGVFESDDESADEQQEFTQIYRQQFKDSLNKSLESVIQNRLKILKRKNSAKAQQFLSALRLFHCQGKSMGEIAPLVNLKAQYQVTRLLKLKELRTDVRQTMLKQLCDRTMAQATNYLSVNQLKQLEQKIVMALDEQIETLIQEAEKEASIAEINYPSTLFSQSLCNYLDLLLRSNK